MEDQSWLLGASLEELVEIPVRREIRMHTDDAVTSATKGAQVGSPLSGNAFFLLKNQYRHLMPWARSVDSVELAAAHPHSPLLRFRKSKASNRRKESDQMPARPAPQTFSDLPLRIDFETVRNYAEREKEWSRAVPIPKVPPVES